MRGSFQVIPGILLAFLSILVVLGSMALSMAESGRMGAVLETSIAVEPNNDNVTSMIRLVTATRIQASIAATDMEQPSATATPPDATGCPHEADWIAYTVVSEVNLVDIAGENNLEPERLRQMNCLSTNRLAVGQTLYLPGPTATPSEQSTSSPTNKKRSTPRSPKKTQVACGAPRGWVIYVVRRGDTLSSLAHRLNTSVPQIQSANCMGNSTLIRAGQRLFVPFLPPPAATPVPARPSPTRPAAQPTNTPLPPPTQPPPTQPPPTQLPPTQLPPTQPPPTQPPPTQPPQPTVEPPTPYPSDSSGMLPITPAFARPTSGAGTTIIQNSMTPR